VSGAALLEVVLSVMTIAILGSALMGSFAYGFHIMRLVRENQRATQIILEKVETVRLYSWDQLLTPGFVPATFTEVYDPQAEPGQRGITYSGTLMITNFPNATSYQNNLRQLVITLDWSTTGNITRTRKLATLVAKDGLQNYVY
jgi:type II secretory pathway pseudopilin PulG